jgi:hypothetical protein
MSLSKQAKCRASSLAERSKQSKEREKQLRLAYYKRSSQGQESKAQPRMSDRFPSEMGGG